MVTALITHPASLTHVNPPGHPEQVARMDAVRLALEEMDLLRVQAPMAAEADMLRVHPKAHLEALRKAAPESGLRQLDADTTMSVGSLEAAWRAAGGAIKAVDMVLSGRANNVFVAMRPPGHHAERETPMGFCLMGSVAAAAKAALDHHGLARVAIIDFDVHHGNGTQNLVEDDPRILFCSSHQMPLYPGTGDPSDEGPHGTVLNVALREGDGSAAFRAVMDNTILPRIRAFNPDLLLISAGFDAHKDDPLAGLELEDDDFAWITQQLCELAAKHCGGRLVSVLEGGYDLEALGRCVARHVTVLKEYGNG